MLTLKWEGMNIKTLEWEGMNIKIIKLETPCRVHGGRHMCACACTHAHTHTPSMLTLNTYPELPC